MSASHRGRVLAAFFAIYFIWGSTFLAVSFAIDTLPPLMMASVRFLIAGGLLYAWARRRGAARPMPVNWTSAVVVGGALILLGTGGAVWAQQRVPSGIIAMLATTVPLWIVLLDWLRPGGSRPTGRIVIGLAAGFAGIGILTGPAAMPGGVNIDRVGALVMLLASFAWAAGSLYARKARMSSCPLLSTAMQLLTGGALLMVAGLGMGEWRRFDITQVSMASIWALIFLTFGSLVAYTAYTWLMTVESPARISTYAYVNPVVAVLLGWMFAGELLDTRTVLALGIILAGVVAINFPIIRKVAVESVAPASDLVLEPDTPQSQAAGAT
ncbi:MAG: EamA family transporter [Chloroflexia bacterium]|nr:EamA family transporter [Chloroflexia bacterium]